MSKYLILLIIIIVSSAYKFYRLSSYTDKFAVSDHFNGKFFYNTEVNQTERKKKINLINFIKWRLSDKSEENWQKHYVYPKKTLVNVENDDEVIVTFINHSTILIQTAYGNIITDPVYSEKVGPFNLIGPRRRYEPAISFDDLPKIDYILISHDHYDHMDLDTIEKLHHRDGSKVIAGLGNGVHQQDLNMIELDWWESKFINENLKIHFVPARHWSGRYGFFLTNKTLWGGFLIEVKGKIIYFAGDTAFTKYFAEIAERFPKKILLSFLPIGAYEPQWIMKNSHIGPEEAVKAHLLLNSQKSIAIHYGTFKLSSEAHSQPIIDLELAKTKYNINRNSFEALQPGESFKIFLD